MTLLDKLYNSFKNFKIFEINHLIYIFSMFFIVVILEVLFLGWRNSSLSKFKNFNNSNRTDLFYWGLCLFNLYSFFSVLFTFGLFFYLFGKVEKHFHFNLILKFENPIIQYVLLFIIADFLKYFRHRIFHKIRLLWFTHSFHHSATELVILTRARGHFIENEISRLVSVFVYVLFGAPIYSFFIINFLTELHQYLLHSQFESNWGWIGRNVLVSPKAHRIHHSIEDRHHNKNFGSTLIIWDRIFKTYHFTNDKFELGIKNDEFNTKGVLFDSFLVYKNFLSYFLFKKKNL